MTTREVPTQAPRVGPLSASSREAFARVFDTEFEYVRRSLARLNAAPSDVEDLAQDVFMSVHRAFESYDPDRPVRPWLFAFVIRVMANYRRLARHREERLTDRVPDQAAEDDPEEALLSRRRRSRLLEALATLPLERASALVMFDMDGMPAPEVAEALEVPINTVYSRVRKAREELRAALHRIALQQGEISPIRPGGERA